MIGPVCASPWMRATIGQCAQSLRSSLSKASSIEATVWSTGILSHKQLLADDEVEYEERQSYLWHIQISFSRWIRSHQIATTRPETMLGDTAVAVAPNDRRYATIG